MHIIRSIWVVLENDLVDGCRAGDDVTVCGSVRRRWQPLKAEARCDLETVIDGNHVVGVQSQKEHSHPHPHPHARTHPHAHARTPLLERASPSLLFALCSLHFALCSLFFFGAACPLDVDIPYTSNSIDGVGLFASYYTFPFSRRSKTVKEMVLI